MYYRVSSLNENKVLMKKRLIASSIFGFLAAIGGRHFLHANDDNTVNIIKNPNKVRALIGGFAANAVHFHALDGSGYTLVADTICELDAFNPQVAARMSGAFAKWRRYDPKRQEMMKEQLRRIKSRDGVSKETFEICQRSLGE